MSNHARRSFLSARDRWGCEYVELVSPCGDLFPGCVKYIGSQAVSGFSRVMFLDADAVISPHAPNPFDLCVSRNTLYVVSDYQAGNQTDHWREHAYREPMAAYQVQHPDFEFMPYDQFFNGGMFLFRPSPAIMTLFYRVFHAMDESFSKLYEQATFNIVAFNDASIALAYLPETWNYMVRKETGPRPDYSINHYGGEMQKVLAELP
jgi:hypothetical protein